MIISASYRTDIPTFYGDWFINRLYAGYCKAINPYNQQVYRVSLAQSDVDGFVFWTKNISPFEKHLVEVQKRGFPFVIQHTINGYPRELEQAVVDWQHSVESLRRIADKYGPRVCVWRYDTIVDSSITSQEFHLTNFAQIAKRLEGVTDEVVISFAQIYQKTLRNMNRSAKENNFTWRDPDDESKRNLAQKLFTIAKNHNIQLTICSQPAYLQEGITESRCIDAKRMSEVAGKEIIAKLKGNRKECGCYESRDIGEYDTCPHGCEYCYAVRNRELALERYRKHDPESEFLFVQTENRNEKDSKRSLV
jgi:hypothetical protein